MADELVDEIYVSCPLIGNTTCKGIVNAAFYQVVAFTETHVQIKNLESDEELSLSVDSIRFLRLGWACTFASIKRRTLRAQTRIWDGDHKNFSTRHLAMAIGRVTRPEDLDIA